MSLGDHLRYLRALADVGINPIAEALGMEQVGPISLAEVRYRPVEDETLIADLAGYYGRPVEEFQWHNARARKYLTFYIQRALENEEPVTLILRGGEALSGQPQWWDLAAIGLNTEDGQSIVVLRHAIVDWPTATEYWWETPAPD